MIHPAKYALKRQLGAVTEYAVSQKRSGLEWSPDVSKAWALRWDYAEHLRTNHGGTIVRHPSAAQLTLSL
jgi:hypothetical protein